MSLLAQPRGGHPLRLCVQLADQSTQLIKSLVRIYIDNSGVKEMAEVVLHLAGLFCHFLQLFWLLKQGVKIQNSKNQKIYLANFVITL